MVLDLGTESELFPSLGDLDLGGDFSAEVFERVLWIWPWGQIQAGLPS
jgi:hypothetical protein